MADADAEPLSPVLATERDLDGAGTSANGTTATPPPAGKRVRLMVDTVDLNGATSGSKSTSGRNSSRSPSSKTETPLRSWLAFGTEALSPRKRLHPNDAAARFGDVAEGHSPASVVSPASRSSYRFGDRNAGGGGPNLMRRGSADAGMIERPHDVVQALKRANTALNDLAALAAGMERERRNSGSDYGGSTGDRSPTPKSPRGTPNGAGTPAPVLYRRAPSMATQTESVNSSRYDPSRGTHKLEDELAKRTQAAISSRSVGGVRNRFLKFPPVRRPWRSSQAQSHVVKELRALQEKIGEEEVATSDIPWIERDMVSAFFGGAILLNALCIGVDAELTRIRGEPLLLMVILESLFLVVFWVEIFMRIKAFGLQFWLDPWGPFDFFTTFLGSLDNWVLPWALDDNSLSGLAVLRTLRLLRLSRLLRTLRFFDQLALLARVLADAGMAIKWVMLLLGLVVYVSSILVKLVLKEEQDRGDGKLADLLSSFPQLFYYHTYLVTAEGYIETFVRATEHLDFPWTVYWSAMVMLCNTFMANLMVGFIVQTHRNLKAQDSDKLPDFLSESELFQKTLRTAFNMIDVDGRGALMESELDLILDSNVLREVFGACGIQMGIPRRFLKSMFGFAGEGHLITFEEFFGTCVKLCGSAHHIQLLMMQYDVSVLQAEVLEGINSLEMAMMPSSDSLEQHPKGNWSTKPSAGSLHSQHVTSPTSWARSPSNEEFAAEHAASAGPSTVPAAGRPGGATFGGRRLTSGEAHEEPESVFNTKLDEHGALPTSSTRSPSNEELAAEHATSGPSALPSAGRPGGATFGGRRITSGAAHEVPPPAPPEEGPQRSSSLAPAERCGKSKGEPESVFNTKLDEVASGVSEAEHLQEQMLLLFMRLQEELTGSPGAGIEGEHPTCPQGHALKEVKDFSSPGGPQICAECSRNGAWDQQQRTSAVRFACGGGCCSHGLCERCYARALRDEVVRIMTPESYL